MRPARRFRQRVIGYYERKLVAATMLTDTREYKYKYVPVSKVSRNRTNITHDVVVDGDWFILINRETREYIKFKTLEALHTAVEFGAIK